MILDTCGLLWLSQGGGKLSRPTLVKIDAASAVYISSISAFEIALKWNAGKLRLPAQPGDWLDIVIIQHDISVIPLSIEICTKAALLPSFHRDPCDRFIIATALTLTLPVVTSDRAFGEYGVSVLQ